MFCFVPIGGAVGIFTVRKFGQDDDGPDFLVDHHRSQPCPSGLLGSKETLRPVRVLGGIEIVAIDAAIRGVRGADAGRQKNHLLAVASLLDECIDKGLLQGEDLAAAQGRFPYGDLMMKTVDDDHDIRLRLPRDLQGIEPGVLQIGAEVSAKIRNPRYSRQR